jgi:hypothetical protein
LHQLVAVDVEVAFVAEAHVDMVAFVVLDVGGAMADAVEAVVDVVGVMVDAEAEIDAPLFENNWDLK